MKLGITLPLIDMKGDPGNGARDFCAGGGGAGLSPSALPPITCSV